MTKTKGYPAFELHCKALKLPELTAEYKFHPNRKWRFDYVMLDKMLAIEIEGGAWTGGRHTRGSGFVKDMEKYNAAAELGYRILRFTPAEARSGKAANRLAEVLKK